MREWLPALCCTKYLDNAEPALQGKQIPLRLRHFEMTDVEKSRARA